MSEDGGKRDLTRWNRAGLSRFAYVDGNAATWLEDLRLAMLVRFLRGVPGAARDERYWRELFARPLTQPERAAAEAQLKALAWQGLSEPLPSAPETARKRNERLLARYGRRSADQTTEIMRAAARAAHVLLGHVDAFANEGYLRTATQWDSMRKLTAMIGYQPTPGAAASTVVALSVDAPGTVEVERGVPMSFTPASGGKPVLFETVDTIEAHPLLNEVRLVGHDFNEQPLSADQSKNHFVLPKGLVPKPGDPVVFVADSRSAAGSISGIDPLVDPTDIVNLKFVGLTINDWVKGATVIHAKPEKVQRTRPRSTSGDVVFETATPALAQEGAVLFYRQAGQERATFIRSARSGRFEVPEDEDLPDDVTFTLATGYDPANGSFVTAGLVPQLWFRYGGQVVRSAGSTTNAQTGAKTWQTPGPGVNRGYTASSKQLQARRVANQPGTAGVEFPGKPSPALVAGAWFAVSADDKGDWQPAQVRRVTSGPESYSVEFDRPIEGSDELEFHGPMLEQIRPEDFDRGQLPLAGMGLRLRLPASEARKLIRVGRPFFVEDESASPAAPVQLTVKSVTIDDAAVVVASLEGFENDPNNPHFNKLLNGWTVLRFNTSRATHGETRGVKVLGSGNAELARQRFHLPIKDITFVPSNASESGVVPDIDVVVQDVMWAYRDLSDPEAEGLDAWSAALLEDDTIDIVFRRRLPTGTNNIVVRRHRVGGGPAGNGLIAYGVTKPARKHRHVVAIVQPLAAAGGSAREPVASMRMTAPAQLVANGRAVSLSDYERLASRHASIWQARAILLPEPGQPIEIVLVPADSKKVAGALEQVIRSFLLDRAPPGTVLRVTDFIAVPILIDAVIRVDLRRYDKDDVEAAALERLRYAFGLQRRGLGQPLLIGEVLAALEEVEGVENASVVLKPAARAPAMTRAPLRFRSRDGQAEASGELQAIFPDPRQVAFLESISEVTIKTEPIP